MYLQVWMQKQRKEEWTNLDISESWLFKQQKDVKAGVHLSGEGIDSVLEKSAE